jgi:hypothetical protein
VLLTITSEATLPFFVSIDNLLTSSIGLATKEITVVKARGGLRQYETNEKWIDTTVNNFERYFGYILYNKNIDATGGQPLQS